MGKNGSLKKVVFKSQIPKSAFLHPPSGVYRGWGSEGRRGGGKEEIKGCISEIYYRDTASYTILKWEVV